jgi:hypothetical protein
MNNKQLYISVERSEEEKKQKSARKEVSGGFSDIFVFSA